MPAAPRTDVVQSEQKSPQTTDDTNQINHNKSPEKDGKPVCPICHASMSPFLIDNHTRECQNKYKKQHHQTSSFAETSSIAQQDFVHHQTSSSAETVNDITIRRKKKFPKDDDSIDENHNNTSNSNSNSAPQSTQLLHTVSEFFDKMQTMDTQLVHDKIQIIGCMGSIVYLLQEKLKEINFKTSAPDYNERELTALYEIIEK
eukprot:242953_1